MEGTNAGAPGERVLDAKACNALLIYPHFDADTFWNFKRTSEVFGAKYPATPLGLITVAALVVLYRPEQLRAHLRRARDNGVTKEELSEAITHLAFYGGFPAAISASSIAAEILGALE